MISKIAGMLAKIYMCTAPEVVLCDVESLVFGGEVVVSIARRGMMSLVSAVAFAIPTAAMAMPVSYFEDVDGDINHLTPVFEFGIGSNTITGSDAHILNMPGVISDVDDFKFSIPSNAVLSAVTFSFANVQKLGSAATVQFVPNLQDVPFTFGAGKVFLVSDGSPFSLFSEELPLPAGTYRYFNSEGFSWSGSFQGGFRYDYAVSFEVSPVPVPSSVPLPPAVWLFISAVAGLLGFSRRKKPAPGIT